LLQSDASSPIDLSDRFSAAATEESPFGDNDESSNSIDPKLNTINHTMSSKLEKDIGDDAEKVPLGKKLKKNRKRRQAAADNDEKLEELTAILREKLEKDDERMRKEDQRLEREEERNRKEDLAREAAVIRDEKFLNVDKLAGALAGSTA
jgi:hypothetical protein